MNYAYKNYLYIYNIMLMEENTLLIKKITFKHAFFCFCFRNNFRKQPNKGQTWLGLGQAEVVVKAHQSRWFHFHPSPISEIHQTVTGFRLVALQTGKNQYLDLFVYLEGLNLPHTHSTIQIKIIAQHFHLVLATIILEYNTH